MRKELSKPEEGSLGFILFRDKYNPVDPIDGKKEKVSKGEFVVVVEPGSGFVKKGKEPPKRYYAIDGSKRGRYVKVDGTNRRYCRGRDTIMRTDKNKEKNSLLRIESVLGKSLSPEEKSMSEFGVSIVGSFSNGDLSKAKTTMSTKILDEMNKLITDEGKAALTYFHQASLVNGRGYAEVAEALWNFGLEEIGHLMKLQDRVNLLSRVPAIMNIPDVQAFTSLDKMIKHQIDLEEDAIESYNLAIQVCRDEGDSGTADYLTEILHDEEKHFDWLSAQDEKIERVGEKAYVQKLDTVVTEEEPWAFTENLPLDDDDDD